MTQKTPFETMRDAFEPKGSAEVVNMTAGMKSPFFGSDLVLSAVDHAEARILQLGSTPDLTEPLSPLEILAIQMLMRASDQDAPTPGVV